MTEPERFRPCAQPVFKASEMTEPEPERLRPCEQPVFKTFGVTEPERLRPCAQPVFKTPGVIEPGRGGGGRVHSTACGQDVWRV